MKRAKACEELVLDLKRTILSGKYSPGSRIPSERELAEKYNTSRIPVREAIEQLAKENILRTEPHVGTFVTDLYDVALLSQSMYPVSRMEKKLLKDSLAARQLIESECARLAAIHASEEEIKEIQESLFCSTNEFRKLRLKKNNSFLGEDAKFHLAIAKASHNQVLYDCLRLSKETISMHQFCSLQKEDSINILPELHFKIYNTILIHDPEEAANAMHDHLQRTIELILALCEEN